MERAAGQRAVGRLGHKHMAVAVLRRQRACLSGFGAVRRDNRPLHDKGFPRGQAANTAGTPKTWASSAGSDWLSQSLMPKAPCSE